MKEAAKRQTVERSRYTVIISAPYMIPFLDLFKPLLDSYNLQIITPPVNERLEETEILQLAGKFDGTICGDDRYTSKVLHACSPRLKVISKWGTGIDSIDKETAEGLNIRVYNTPNAFTKPVADSVMAYILAFARKQPWMDKEIKKKKWHKLSGRSLSECILGVVGVGSIGKAVLTRGKAFGMKLLGTDIVEIDAEFITQTDLEMTTLLDLLSRSDFVSLNCDLNPTSFHLLNRETIPWMKPDAVLINTARGPVVDEQALIDALQSGIIGGAGMDVFEVEPLPKDSPLLNLDNVLLAPHNANSSPTAWDFVHRNSIRNLLRGLGLPFEELGFQTARR